MFCLDFQSTPGRGLSSGSEVSGPGGLKTLGNGSWSRPPGGVGWVHKLCTPRAQNCARACAKLQNSQFRGRGGYPPRGGPKMTILGGWGGRADLPPGSRVFVLDIRQNRAEFAQKTPVAQFHEIGARKVVPLFRGCFWGGFLTPPVWRKKFCRIV